MRGRPCAAPPSPSHLPAPAPPASAFAPASSPQVRAFFGIPRRPDATGVDAFNMLAATLFFCYALWIVITGRKV